MPHQTIQSLNPETPPLAKWALGSGCAWMPYAHRGRTGASSSPAPARCCIKTLMYKAARTLQAPAQRVRAQWQQWHGLGWRYRQLLGGRSKMKRRNPEPRPRNNEPRRFKPRFLVGRENVYPALCFSTACRLELLLGRQALRQALRQAMNLSDLTNPNVVSVHHVNWPC